MSAEEAVLGDADGKNWVFDVFKPEDADGVIELYREIYGEKFPLKDVYDAAWHIRQAQTGDTCRCVARLPNGKLAGTIALFRSVPTNRELYEGGGLIVSNDYRTQSLPWDLFIFLHGPLMKINNIKYIWGEAVCNHLVSQQLSVKSGYVACALEVEMMPEAAYSKLDERRQNTKSRVSNMVLFASPCKTPMDVYLPGEYEDALIKIYAPFEFGHRFQRAAAGATPEEALTCFHREEYIDSSFARISVSKIGRDFPQWLTTVEAELRGKGIAVSEFILPLNTLSVEMATQELVKNGFWLGGLMPLWFGCDGFLMQRTAQRPDFDKLRIYSKPAKEVFALVKADFEKKHGALGA